MGEIGLIILELLQCAAVLIFFIKTFTQAHIKFGYYICFFVALLLIVLGQTSSYRRIVDLVLFIFVYGISPLIFIRGMKKTTIIYFSLFVVGTVSLVNSCVDFIVSLMNMSGILNDLMVIIIRSVAMLVLLGIINFPRIKSTIIDLVSVSKGIKLVLLFFVWELFFLNTLQNVILSMNFGTKVNLTVGSAVLVTVIISFVVIQLLISNNIQSSYYKKLNVTMEKNVLQQVQHYQQMSKAYENLRKFKHDFNNIIIGLNTYLRNGDAEQAKLYLSRLTEMAETDQVMIQTGNSLVDSLINDKLASAEKHNIDVDFDGLIPKEIMDPIDLCVVFGNALDNATEACLKLPQEEKKVIGISVKQRADTFFVKITNPVNEEVNIRNNSVITTKDDTFSHGIGLYSIRKIIEKYNGHFNLQCNSHLFTAEMDFAIKQC